MADSKISALAAAASAADANELAINEAGTSKKLTVAQIKTLISAATLGLPLALTGATAATRYVGATATGAPTSGTFAVGDFVITQDGSVYICTGAGSPGTWAAVSGGGGSVATDAIWDAAGDLAVGSGANTAAKLTAGAENTVLAVVSGVPAWVARTALPTLTQAVVSTYASSGTTAVATMGSAPTNGNYLYAVIGSTGRGCDSITQTNVSWAKIYGGNGNSQYFELWKGTVSASAGTSVTANFTGSNKQEIAVAEWGTLNLSTAGTAKTITSAAGTAPSFWTVPLTTSPGDYVVVGISANAPSSQELKIPIPRLPWAPVGGQECSAIARSPGGSIVAWGSISSSVAYFGAMFVLS
jgi:hypothetical protein